MDTLDVWPALPLIISDCDCLKKGSCNIFALLENSDRVCQISFMQVTYPQLFENVLKAMQEPFPELTDLVLWSHYHETTLVLPDSFLGGFAPRLRNLFLNAILFPGLLKLLLSSTHLVSLSLSSIPHSEYFSPEEMVTVLSTLTSLESLCLELQSLRPLPNRANQHSPSSTRSALPVFTELRFSGPIEYLEDFMARINAPQLSTLDVAYPGQVGFDAPQLVEFICRTPKLNVLENAYVIFGEDEARVTLLPQTSDHRKLTVCIFCGEPDLQVSSLMQVFTSSLPLLSKLEDLYIHEENEFQLDWQDNIEIVAWLELLHPFTGVKNLYISKKFGPRIAPALQELVGGRTTEVMPVLQKIFLEGLESSGIIHEGIGQFIAARQVTSHPVTVTCWEEQNGERQDREDDEGEGDDEDEDEDEDKEGD